MTYMNASAFSVLATARPPAFSAADTSPEAASALRNVLTVRMCW
jgi:hypothetical protein